MAGRSGIYCIRCEASGKEYYGSTSDWRTRKYSHLRNLRRGTHKNPHLQNAFNKHGESQFSFTLIHEVPVDCLLVVEQAYLDSFPCEFNVSKNAACPRRGMTNSHEMRMKCSNSLKGRTVSRETRDKIRAALLGRKQTEDHKANAAAALVGRRLSIDAKSRIGAASRGRNLGEKSGRSKLLDVDRQEICRRMELGCDKHSLAAEYGIDESTVRHIVNVWKPKKIEVTSGI